MTKRYQTADEACDLDDDARVVLATYPDRAAVAHANVDLSDWAPGDGDYTSVWVQEEGRPETRQEYRVAASYSIDLRATLVRK